jgi:hypothetical protein
VARVDVAAAALVATDVNTPCAGIAAVGTSVIVWDDASFSRIDGDTATALGDEEVEAIAVRGELAFVTTLTAAGGRAIWRVTTAGAEKIAGGGAWDSVAPLGWAGDRWYFIGTSDGSPELWVADADSSTSLDAAVPDCLREVDGEAWLWTGTDRGIVEDDSVVAAAPLPGFAAVACELVVAGDRLLYQGEDAEHGAELWTARTRDVAR